MQRAWRCHALGVGFLSGRPAKPTRTRCTNTRNVHARSGGGTLPACRGTSSDLRKRSLLFIYLSRFLASQALNTRPLPGPTERSDSRTYVNGETYRRKPKRLRHERPRRGRHRGATYVQRRREAGRAAPHQQQARRRRGRRQGAASGRTAGSPLRQGGPEGADRSKTRKPQVGRYAPRRAPSTTARARRRGPLMRPQSKAAHGKP